MADHYVYCYSDIRRYWQDCVVWTPEEKLALVDSVEEEGEHKLLCADVFGGQLNRYHYTDVRPWWPDAGYYTYYDKVRDSAYVVEIMGVGEKQYHRSCHTDCYWVGSPNSLDLQLLDLCDPVPQVIKLDLVRCIADPIPNQSLSEAVNFLDDPFSWGITINRKLALVKFIYTDKLVLVYQNIPIGVVEGDKILLSSTFDYMIEYVSQYVPAEVEEEVYEAKQDYWASFA